MMPSLLNARRSGERHIHPESWIVCSEPRSSEERIRLFCFHHAGGNAATFRDWPSGLPEWIEVCAVQLPGRGSLFNHPRHKRLEPLVSDLLPRLRPWLDKPFAFFGHSLGALVALAVTHGLVGEGGPVPRHLFLSAFRPLHLPRKRANLADAPEEELLQAIWDLQPESTEVLQNSELCSLLLPILRDDFAISETCLWTDRAPLSCPISVFGGADDFWAEPEVLGEWSKYTRAAFETKVFSGGHFFINQSAHDVLNVIPAILAQ
jgi:medium-chain acyl-[acyl-carrier-protein] hydrolase